MGIAFLRVVLRKIMVIKIYLMDKKTEQRIQRDYLKRVNNLDKIRSTRKILMTEERGLERQKSTKIGK